MGSWMIADPLKQVNFRQPPLASGDSIPISCQNVAGLWLKYGAKSLKIETSPQYSFHVVARRFVSDNR